jgi:membrane protease YdiL (CAAX protease family)
LVLIARRPRDPLLENVSTIGFALLEPEENPDARAVVAIAIVTEGGLTIVALALGWFLARPPWMQIDRSASAWTSGFLAAIPLVIGLVLTTRYPVGPFRGLQDVMREWIIPLFRSCAPWQLLLISCLAGLSEELLFRGVLQRGIEQFSGSPWLALAVASALFGLAHPITPTYALLAALIGVYLGGLMWATDNLLPPMVAHAAYDFVALVYLVRKDQPPTAQ